MIGLIGLIDWIDFPTFIDILHNVSFLHVLSDFCSYSVFSMVTPAEVLKYLKVRCVHLEGVLIGPLRFRCLQMQGIHPVYSVIRVLKMRNIFTCKTFLAGIMPISLLWE